MEKFKLEQAASVHEHAQATLRRSGSHVVKAAEHHWTDNYYITSRYFPEFILSDVM